MDVHDFPEKSQVKPERISKEKSQNVAEELARAPAGEGLGAKGVPRGCQGGAKGVPRPQQKREMTMRVTHTL